MLPPEAASASPDARVGKFILVTRLGAGGGGEVWKAWDTGLGRWVALKFLRGADAESLARFKREAQLAARLAHPGIAAIYEVADAPRPHIAMQFVIGSTLRASAPRDPRALAAVLRDAARAVAAAHDAGVVHRDLKPENVMIGPDGRVTVLDFGLARPIAAAGPPDATAATLPAAFAGVTATGAILGTPAYMAPEQARGERVDARADVYGLGATLYEALAGRPPFRAPTLLQLLVQVQQNDPPPLKGVEPELEAVALRCLEKEPSRRYATAAELADDLDRFVRREPVRARRVSRLRRVRRHLAPAAGLAVAALVIVGLLLALRGKERDVAEARRELLAQVRSTADVCLRAALDLRRGGDVAGMKRYADEVEAVCLRVIAELPDAAEPHYRLGRIRRAQMRDAEALAEQTRAIAKDPSLVAARYERVVLGARAYRARVFELIERELRAYSARVAEQGRTAEARTWREAAREDAETQAVLARLNEDIAAIERAPSALSEGELLCARGMKAWADIETGRAMALLRDAVARAPDLEEAYEILALMEVEGGRDPERYDRAVRWLDAAIDRDRGYLPHLVARAKTHGDRGYEAHRVGGDPREAFEAALRDFEEALRREPDRGDVLVWCANTRSNLGLERVRRGEDPVPYFEAGMRDLDRAVRLAPRNAAAWSGRGHLRARWADHEATRGGGAAPLYAAAVEDLGRAIELEPAGDRAWVNRALAWLNWGNWRQGRGEDPREALDAAIADCDEALKRRATRGETHKWRGAARLGLAAWRSEHGEDAAGLYREAIADLTKASALDAEDVEAREVRGMAYARFGRSRQGAPDEAGLIFAAAIGEFDGVVAADGTDTRNLLRRANAWHQWGIAWKAAGRDPTPKYERAMADCDEAIRRRPARDDGWMARAEVRQSWADHVERSGGDPRPLLQAAVSDYGETLARNPGSARAWWKRGETHSSLGAVEQGAGRDPSAQYREAEADLAEAIRRGPRWHEPWRARGAMRFNWGLWLGSRREASAARFEEAAGDYDRAIDAAPDVVDLWRERGLARAQLGFARMNEGGDAEGAVRAGIGDLDVVVTKRPKEAQDVMMRGMMKEELGRWLERERGRAAAEPWARGALGDYETAARLDPALGKTLMENVERCRRLLK